MFLVLFAMILRPVAFKYRSKREDARWRSNWDWALFIGGAVPALVFGVAVGNALRGVPFHFSTDLRPFYEGTLFGLLNPVAFYCGLVSLAMLVMHGAAWLAFKAEGPVADRAPASLAGRQRWPLLFYSLAVIARFHHPIWTKFASVTFVAIGVSALWLGMPIVPLALAFYGAGIGLESIARGTLPLAMFGSDDYAKLMGRLAMPSLIAQAAAPSIGALLLERFGAYGTLATLAGLALINVALACGLGWLVFSRRGAEVPTKARVF